MAGDDTAEEPDYCCSDAGEQQPRLQAETTAELLNVGLQTVEDRDIGEVRQLADVQGRAGTDPGDHVGFEMEMFLEDAQSADCPEGISRAEDQPVDPGLDRRRLQQHGGLALDDTVGELHHRVIARVAGVLQIEFV